LAPPRLLEVSPSAAAVGLVRGNRVVRPAAQDQRGRHQGLAAGV